MMKPLTSSDIHSSYITSTSLGLSGLCLGTFTFKHFHSHSGVSSFSFQPECCCLDNFPKLSFSQRLAKHKVFTRKLPLWILLLRQGNDGLYFSKDSTYETQEMKVLEEPYRYFKGFGLN